MSLIGQCLAVDHFPEKGQRLCFAPFMLQQARFAALKSKASVAGFPLQLQWSGKPRLNIVGGYGVRLGDTILGLQAAHYFRKRVAPHVKLHYHLVDDPQFDFREIYDLFGDVSYDLLPLVAQADTLIDADFCDVFYRPQFETLTLQDTFFELMGLPWRDIPAKEKKPFWLKEKITSFPKNDETIWLVPYSSDPIRSFSSDLIERICAQHPRVRLIPLGLSYRQYIELLAGARALISTDTSAYHITAAWDIPTCVVFGHTLIIQDGYEVLHHIKAEKRISYYPQATALQLPSDALLAKERDHLIDQFVCQWLKDL